MQSVPESKASNEDPNTPSREEIENICLLGAVGSRICNIGELADRLGLSRLLAPALREAVQTVVSRGWLAESDDQLALTDTGHSWLNSRLSRHNLSAEINPSK